MGKNLDNTTTTGGGSASIAGGNGTAGDIVLFGVDSTSTKFVVEDSNHPITDFVLADDTKITIALSGTTPTQIKEILFGCIFIAVRPALSGGPSGSFVITKISATEIEPKYTQELSHAESILGTKFVITWPSNDNLYIAKTTADDDGNYIINFI